MTVPDETSGVRPATPLSIKPSRNPNAQRRSPTRGNATFNGASLSGNRSCASEFRVQLTSDKSEVALRSPSKRLGPKTTELWRGSQARAPLGKNVKNTGGGPVRGNSSKTCVAVNRRPGPIITPLPRQIVPLSVIFATTASASPASYSDPIGPIPPSSEYLAVFQDRRKVARAGLSSVISTECVSLLSISSA